MELGRIIADRWYLFVALAAILLPTIVLAAMQYVSVRRTEAQARATLEANLDLHLLGLIDEARRDLVDRASYITHSVSHSRIRSRNLPGLARSFTRAMRRYPEMRDLYAIFFEKGNEMGAWQVWCYVPPDPEDPSVERYKEVPVGRLKEDPDITEALRRAWMAIPDRKEDATYTNFAPTSLSDPVPRQIFYHPVYEPDHMNRKDDLDRVGLIAFTAEIDSYPYAGYLRDLVALYDQRMGGSNPLGPLAYKVSISDRGGRARDLVLTGSPPGSFRHRGFDDADRLFPGISFGVALRDRSAAEFASQNTGLSLLLGVGAAVLLLIGLALTWHATVREIRVAELKSDFLASISHELKTPLTAIRAFGDLLRSGRARDKERIRQYGEMISYESDRLTTLLNNILEMSRIERSARRYKLEKGDLGAAVAASVEVFRAATRARGFEIEVEIPSTPIITQFDKNALDQALVNLLSNAVKYSSESRRVKVRVWSDEAEAAIDVRDFGIGIDPAEQRRIFDAFHRAPQSEVQAKSGTGLGLAIVREIIRAHGGEVSVDSKVGVGATFTIRLPLLTPDLRQGQSSPSEEMAYGRHSGNRRRTERIGRLVRQLGIRRLFGADGN
ncbi:MAG: HAMP domain-containing histidine kinase [Blastocatellia bacterium]|nr:HAMP domain-containing histidine kinase [Blastocatellia bacterium]